MHVEPPQPAEPALEERLRASRPLPDPTFVAALEERLLPRSQKRAPRRGRRPLLAAAGAAGALAAAALAFSLIGGGPLAPGGNDSVKARDDCRYVAVRKRERTPTVAVGRDGSPRIRYRSELVTRRVKRCR